MNNQTNNQLSLRSMINEAVDYIRQTHSVMAKFEVTISDAFSTGLTRDLKPHIGCYDHMFVVIVSTNPGFVPAMFLKLVFTDTFAEETCSEFNTDKNPVFVELYDNVFERYSDESIRQQEIAVFVHGSITPLQLAENILYPHFNEQQLHCPYTTAELSRDPDINRGKGVKVMVCEVQEQTSETTSDVPRVVVNALDERIKQAIEIFNESDKLFLGVPIGYDIEITGFDLRGIDDIFNTMHYVFIAKVNYPEYNKVYISPDCSLSAYIRLEHSSTVGGILSTALYPAVQDWVVGGQLDNEDRLVGLGMTLCDHNGDHEVVDVDKHINVALPLLSTLKKNIRNYKCETYINNGDVGVDAPDLIKAHQALLALNSALKNIKVGDTTTEE